MIEIGIVARIGVGNIYRNGNRDRYRNHNQNRKRDRNIIEIGIGIVTGIGKIIGIGTVIRKYIEIGIGNIAIIGNVKSTSESLRTRIRIGIVIGIMIEVRMASRIGIDPIIEKSESVSEFVTIRTFFPSVELVHGAREDPHGFRFRHTLPKIKKQVLLTNENGTKYILGIYVHTYIRINTYTHTKVGAHERINTTRNVFHHVRPHVRPSRATAKRRIKALEAQSRQQRHRHHQK